LFSFCSCTPSLSISPISANHWSGLSLFL
jgi:hypothetical protein